MMLPDKARNALQTGRAAVSELPWQTVAFVGGTTLAYTAIGELSDNTVGPGWQAAAGILIGGAGSIAARRREWNPVARNVADGIFIGGVVAALRGIWDGLKTRNSDDPRAAYTYSFCAPNQRRTDLDPPPDWLSVDTEVCGGSQRFATRESFAATIFEKLLSLGLPAKLAFEVTAHFATETGFGQQFSGNNLGGWKVTEDWARAFQRAYGRPAAWWRAAGHTDRGDLPTVYYRAYPSIEAFLLDWIDRFIPRPGTVEASAKYARTGELAWSGGDWFAEMLRQGYRGAVTRDDPSPSIGEQNTQIARMRALYGQYKLGRTPASLTLDAADQQAITAAQGMLGVQQTGQVDDATAVAMARYTGITAPSAMPLQYVGEAECTGYVDRPYYQLAA